MRTQKFTRHTDNPQVACVRTKFGTFELNLSAGSRDRVSMWREGDTVYILTTNKRLGYVGLERVNLPWLVSHSVPRADGTHDVQDIMFTQNPDDYAEYLRKPWDEYEDYNLVKLLRQWEEV